MYWDINRTLSYNALINFVLGGRGKGKSYGFKKRGFKNFEKTEEQFVYLRRYKEETKISKSKFLDDMYEEFPHNVFDIKGSELKIGKETCAHFLTLSTSGQIKSVPYPRVTLIGFDEFILDTGVTRYLPNEVNTFNNLYSTIARTRDVKVLFLANAITVTNPYFLDYGIKLPGDGREFYRHSKDILVQLVKSKEHDELMRNTRFMQAQKEDSNFVKFAIDNEFYLDNDVFIKKKTGKCSYFFTFTYKSFTYGVWRQNETGILFVSNDIESDCPVKYAMTLEDHRPNMMLLQASRSSHIKMLTDAIKFSCVYFEDVNIKNNTFEAFKYKLQ